MIDAENIWALWTVLIVIAAISIYLEQHYRWAAKISGAIIGLLLSASLSNLGVIPTDSVVYDTVWSYVVPLAIPMLLFQCDLRQIWKESGRLVIIFLLSSLGTVLGAVVGYLFLHQAIPVLNHIAGMMVGSYIGGGVNFVAIASAFELPKDLISAATVADNLLMVVYFFVLIVLPSVKIFSKHFLTSYPDGITLNKELDKTTKKAITVEDLAITFAVSATIVTVSFALSDWLATLGNGPLVLFISNKYLILTTLTVILATIGSKWFKRINAANEVGTFLIYLFFVVIGVPASIPAIIEKSPLLLVFCSIMVLINMIVTFAAAKVFHFTIEEAILASNANIGGPTTAAAMAISKGWHSLVAPTMLVGTLGYILGTYIGIFIGQLLQ